MKILILAPESEQSERMKETLTGKQHDVQIVANKDQLVERVSQEAFDVVMIDPAPAPSAVDIVAQAKRRTKKFLYYFLLSANASREDALKDGVNELLSPAGFDQDIDQKLADARHFLDLVERIGNESEDFPSAGGVIAKSAFNQLFLSSIDRAERYGERSFVLFISLSNYQEIIDMDGPYASEHAVAHLSKFLVRIRRQSDIIGQTAKNEFALLLQRPNYETEPMDAANRFGDTLEAWEDADAFSMSPMEFSVSLVDLPNGSQVVKHRIHKERSV